MQGVSALSLLLKPDENMQNSRFLIAAERQGIHRHRECFCLTHVGVKTQRFTYACENINITFPVVLISSETCLQPNTLNIKTSLGTFNSNVWVARK